MSFGYILGILLLLWVAYDLYNGSTWLHRQFHRSEQPFAYWSVMLLWLLVAISCFFWDM